MTISARSRVAVALVSLCLGFASTVASASPTRVVAPAVMPVAPADPGGGWTMGGHGNANQTTKSGNATGGGATAKSSGGADVYISYNTPADGTTYNGSWTATSYDANGNQVATGGAGISDTGNGAQLAVGFDGFNVPVGGSVVINVSESNGRGSWFGAGFRLTNYQP